MADENKHAISQDMHNGNNAMLQEKSHMNNDLEKKGSDIDAPLVEETNHHIHVLFPQPVDDPLDPLNWSFMQKHGILAIVMALYFMFTYITTTTVPSFPEIQEQYGITADQLNWTVAIPALGLAVGPLIWSSFADIVGRRVIFIAGTVIALAATIGAALAPNYGGYMAARFFQGLGVSPAATVGLSIINDLFFEHERGQKVGFWVLAIDLGLYVGPLIGGFIDLVSHIWIQWLTAILFGVILLAEIFFLPETLYPREFLLQTVGPKPFSGLSSGSMPTISEKTQHHTPASVSDVRRTKKLLFINVKPVPALKHPKPWDSLIRFFLLFRFVVIPMAVVTFCFGWYWWVLSIATMLPVAYATYSPQIQGLFFLGLILGTIFSEVFCSGRLSDWLVVKLAKKQGGVKMAEMRLWLAYPAALISAIGLIIWGVSIDKNYHWIVGQIAFFLFGAGIQMGNAAIAAYIIDCYPLQSMSIVTFYSVVLNLSAFINPFFIFTYVTNVGYTWTFASQGIITFFFCVPVLACLHYFGGRLRAKNGIPGWVNPEYEISTSTQIHTGQEV